MLEFFRCIQFQLYLSLSIFHHSHYCVCLFVCLSEVFLQNHSQRFIIFCMKLGCHLSYKMTEPDFFEKKSYFEVFVTKRPKMRFFKFYEKLTHGIFPGFFCMKFKQFEVCKLTEISFQEVLFSFSGQKGLKWTQNEVFKFF